MSAYYNENDPKAAAWLRELIREGHIANGVVDERSIEDVFPADLISYSQCHFFAGIGGWSYALRLAGWPDDRPVWTGSCPCQPFSTAGKGKGFADERHLWPAWQWLIARCQPVCIFGEQVANATAWLDLVFRDLEAEGYAGWATVLGAHSVGAPHIRQRLYWVAYDNSRGQQKFAQFNRNPSQDPADGDSRGQHADGCGVDGAVEYTEGDRRLERGTKSGERSAESRCEPSNVGNAMHAERWPINVHGEDGLDRQNNRREEAHDELGAPGEVCNVVGHADGERLEGRSVSASGRANEHSPWTPSDVVWCRDGKWRPVEPGAQQMANGLSVALGFVRGFGHAEKEALNHAASSTGFVAEVLHQMQDGVDAPTIWRAFGGCVGFPEASILLAYLCEQSGELGQFFRGSQASSAEIRKAAVRALRKLRSAACASPRQGLSKQFAWELRNAMPKLPQESASLALFNGFPLVHGAPGRVGLLRGYGNAIVPQVAAAFIEAYLA